MPEGNVPLSLEAGERLVELGWGYGIPGEPNGRCGAWLFAYRGHDAEASLAAARDAWIARVRRERASVEHDFGRTPNWGDFLGDGAEELRREGLRPLWFHVDEVLPTVDHDEILDYLEAWGDA